MKKLVFILFFFIEIAACEKPVLFVVGTRPEAIKMLPLYKKFKENNIFSLLCHTGQHADLLSEVFTIFQVKPDYDIKIMKPNQDLSYITEAVLNKMKDLLMKIRPCLVVVQGDTTSAMASAMAAFYEKIPVAHIEAGLRTNKKYCPFPEEMNRCIISRIASFHFAPTAAAVDNLMKEGIDKSTVFLVGNTVVDAFLEVDKKIKNQQIFPLPELVDMISKQKKNGGRIFLLTVHRRETVDGGLEKIYNALISILEKHSDIFIIYPVHPNPRILEVLEKSDLNRKANIKITSPLAYSDMVFLLRHVDGVLTDSGGIQEEASVIGKPVIVLRKETERVESIQNNNAIIAFANEEMIFEGIEKIIKGTFNFSINTNLYGDGTACDKIFKIINENLENLRE